MTCPLLQALLHISFLQPKRLSDRRSTLGWPAELACVACQWTPSQKWEHCRYRNRAFLVNLLWVRHCNYRAAYSVAAGWGFGGGKSSCREEMKLERRKEQGEAGCSHRQLQLRSFKDVCLGPEYPKIVNKPWRPETLCLKVAARNVRLAVRELHYKK